VLGVQAANADSEKKSATVATYYTIIRPSPPACTPHPPTTLDRHKVCHLLSHKQHLPVSSAIFISFPTWFIRELPRQPIMMSQTCTKVSLVAFLFRQWCRNWFCSTLLGVLVTSFKSPSEIMSWSSRSYTMALASTSAMKHCRNMSRTCSTVSMEREELCHTNC